MSIKENIFAPWASGLDATRRAAMLLLVMMLTTTTAWATSISTINVGGTDYTLFTGFTATSGTNVDAAAYNYPKLVDGNLDGSSSWHLNGEAQPYYIEFNSDDPIIPKGYIFNTYSADNFKPTDWVLKAKADAGDSWTTLSSYSGQSLASGQEFQYACDNSGNNAYKYFRFEVSKSNNNIWLTEIRLYGFEALTYTHLTVRAATCTEVGIKQDCYQRNDGKYFTDETGATELTEADVIDPMIPHTGVYHAADDDHVEYWQCSMCSKYFTDEGCTQEVTADEVLKTVFGTLTAGTNGASGYYTLESKTYTLTDDVNTVGYIYIPAGVTATIDLNGHTIDRGLTNAITNGMVIWVAGSLTVTDSGTGGKIKGGMDSSADHVSCVKVYSDNGSPAFTLQGGTLIGNTSYQFNHAVCASNSSNITISGGKITGDVYGIESNGHVTVTGGEISGNTCGIWSNHYSVSVSGNPVITNNTNANVVLYYYDASVLTIAGELTAGANIGITKDGDRPTDNAPVTITNGYSTYNSEPIDTYFSLDNNGQIQTGPSEYMTLVMSWNEDKTEIAVGTAMRTVSFDLRGHGSAIDAISLLSGYKLIEPTEPTAEGWSFGGWYTDEDFTDGNEWNFDSGVTSDMTLYALWTQGQTHRVTLPENMIIVSADNEAVGGKYPSGTVVRFKVAPDYVVDGDVKNGEDVLTADGDGIYTITVADANITITATVKKAAEPNKTLSGSESYTAKEGDVLTGSTSGTVTIANNANITLSDVTITGGIVCEGSATITLVGTNSVSGATNTAGIQIGGSGTTLTINGDGSLTANGGDQSAGIGLSRAWDPANDVIGGDIVIEGGNITANGGSQWGAGIGTGVIYGNGSEKTARIGNITIKGGTVKATGGTSADGIGTGYTYTPCTNAIGTVTIYDGIDKVDASSIKNSGSIVYKHETTDVTASKSDYFTIIENGNRLIIVQKVTPTIADVPDQTYTGSAITPEPTVIAGSLSLAKGTDYTYSYTNNTNVGTATVRATFQGTYASLGYVEKTFTIAPSTIMVSVAGGGTVTIGDKSASDGEAFGVMSEKGASVVLTLAPESGNAVRSVEYGYTNSEGTNMSGATLPISDGTATLTVPNDLKDGTGVTLTVTFTDALVGGADEASAVALIDATVTDLAGGWYKVESDITFDHTLNLLGDTHLTIASGATMTVSTATGKGIDSDYTLNVGGAGALSVTASGSNKIAIRVGNYVQTGATVTASGFIGIRCCDDFDEFNVTNDFTFSGGQLTATGTSDGIRVDNTITISCTNGSDFIQSSSYDGTIKVADGKALTDGMNIYTGTLTSTQITAIGGKNLVYTKAENPATVTGTVSVQTGNHTVDLSAYVALNGATGTVSYEISGEAKGCTLHGSVLTSGTNTGSVTVNVTVAADNNYLESSDLTITVNVTDKATQTISFADATLEKTWGDEDFTVTTTGAETNVSYAITSGDAATVDSSTGKVHIVKAGTVTITATAKETSEYTGASASYTLTINRKAVTVKADNKTMVYGASEPELTATVTGLVGDDTVAYTLSRAEGTAIGTYTITPTGDATQGNYTVTYETGTFTITDKPVYAVTVEHGTGDGSFEEGATVTITADAPETGKEFDKWTTNDGVTFADANSATTTFTMPAKAVTVTAIYKTSKTDPTITKTPAAKTGLVYNGQAQALITAGEVTGGTFYYALGNETEATQPYTTSIPTATDAGTYYVWYKVKGDSNHNDTDAASITVSIEKGTDPAVVTNKATVQKGGKTLDLSKYVSGAVGNVSFAFKDDNAKYGCSINGNTFTSGTDSSEVEVRVTIAESGNYNGRDTDIIKVSVVDKEVKSLEITQSDVEYGTEVRPSYSVEGTKTSETVHYSGTLRNGNNYDSEIAPTDIGSYAVSVVCETDTEIYSGSTNFMITAANISSAEVTLGEALTYNRTEQTMTVTEVRLRGTVINTSAYTITGNKATDAGDYTLTITAKDDSNYTGTTTKSYKVNKAAGDSEKPVKPELKNKSATTIEVIEKDGFEYSIDDGASWQSDGKFEGLTNYKEYSIITRKAETKNYEAGAISDALHVWTDMDIQDGEEADSGIKHRVEDRGTITGGTGEIETETIFEPGVPHCTIGNLTISLAELLLTDEERQAVIEGAPLLLALDMKDIDDSVSEEDVHLAEEAAKTASSNAVVGMYLDLTLKEKIGNSAEKEITDTKGNKIHLEMDVPDKLKNTNPKVIRTFYIIRMHDGVAEILAFTTDTHIPFDTDLFSTYAIAYSDINTEDENGTAEPEKSRTVVEVEGTNGIKVSYSSEITFTKKKAAFDSGDVKVYAADGSEIGYKKIKIRKANKAGNTTFKISGAKISDKKARKAFNKKKFQVTIVPYEVTAKDSVNVKTNKKGKIKKVTVNGIKLKKSEYSGDATALTFKGRFKGNWKKD